MARDISEDDTLVLVESIRIPLELAYAFRRLLHESQGPREPTDDVVIVDDSWATVKCRAEYVPHVRLLWRGFQAGIRHLAEITPPSSAGRAPSRSDGRPLREDPPAESITQRRGGAEA